MLWKICGLILLSCLLCLEYRGHARSDDVNEETVQHTLTGNIHLHKNFHSRLLPTDRDIIVYLPPDYEKNLARRYPVLYMQDGQNLFDAATSFFHGMERHMDEKAQELITCGQMQPIIIVGIYSTGQQRINEYTPTREGNEGGEADLYGRMLVEEIKPFIDSCYRTLQDRRNTGLGGSSLGGILSIHLGFKYPHVFGKLAITSPAAYWDNEAIIKSVQNLRRKTGQRIWLGIGTGEASQFLTSTRKLYGALLAKGWRKGKDISYMEAAGAEHNPEAWAKRVEPLLLFLFPPKLSN